MLRMCHCRLGSQQFAAFVPLETQEIKMTYTLSLGTLAMIALISWLFGVFTPLILFMYLSARSKIR